MINFPNLDIEAQEIKECKKAESGLTKKISNFFDRNYGLRPPVRVSGSTEKGTALPGKYFGTDIDVAVQGNSSLVDRIAYPNNVFEGCPLFSMDFFQRFAQEFPEVYFAGHRLSGIHDGWQFDFAIADSNKDQWKWVYNNSRFLDFSDSQTDAAKKLKFFLKTFNLAGSEVNGVVGPALELMVCHHKDLKRIFKKMGQLSPIPESFSNHFGTVLFPEEYKSLFPELDDYIHRGLIDSFKYTTPNTYNRLIECVKTSPESSEDFVGLHKPEFSYSREVPSNHYKMLAHLLGTSLSEQPFFHIDILSSKNNMRLYANANPSQRELLDTALDSFESIPSNQNISYERLPKAMQQDLQSKLNQAPERYTYFVGSPTLPLSKDKVYVPFDFLLREDCADLIEISERGQNGFR